MDLASRYWQIELKEKNKEKAALLAVQDFVNLTLCFLDYVMSQQHFKD